MIDAYPLQWPAGWPRTKNTKTSQFKTSFVKARDGLLYELYLLKAQHIVISSNAELRYDGLPKSPKTQPKDRGIAVYFVLDSQQQCVPCDKWDHIEDNLQAIRLTIEALRGLERWGAKEMVSAAFKGFAALPASVEKAWYQVLQVSQGAREQEIRDAFRNLARIEHPDAGGSVEAFLNLQRAFEEGLKAVNA